jgi:aerobic carbon-monoxide dehydrogenase medium subunit
VIPAAFDYVRAARIEEAIDALADPEAKAIAGGHSLLPLMKLRLARPTTLVDIAALELGDVGIRDGELRIGALATYDELLRRGDLPQALREAVQAVGDVQVRNAGTIGGALAHADPACDVAAAVLALHGRIVVRSPSGAREASADGFFEGPFATALDQQELITEIVIPLDGGRSAYVSFEDRASGYPLAGAAVHFNGTTTVALTGYGSHPRIVDGDPGDVLGPDPDHRRRLAELAIERALERAERS